MRRSEYAASGSNQSLSFRLQVGVVVFLLLLPVAVQAGVQVRLEPEFVREGGRVLLTIEVDGAGAGLSSPDFNPLQRDFRLLDGSSSRQVQVLNGKRTEKRRWTAQLEPRRSGKILIPPLTVGTQTTSPMSLFVQPSAAMPQEGVSDTDGHRQQDVYDTPPQSRLQPAQTGQRQGNQTPGLPSRFKYYLYWVLAAVLATWLLVRLRRWFINERQRNDSALQNSAQRERLRKAQRGIMQRLREACEQNDPVAAEHALLQLAALKWPNQPPRNLSDLARRLDSGGKLVREVERALFGKQKTPWQGGPLWQLFENGIDRLLSASGTFQKQQTRALRPG